MSPTTPPVLPSDLEAGLRRLKLAAIRREAPEVLLTAKTQRWAPEETLRVLVDLEIAARDQSNTRARMKAAHFPVDKTLDEFNLDESSIPPPTHDYLVTLDWIRRADNLCLIGPAGTGKTHYLIALGRAAVEAGHRVRYYTAIDLVETLWRAMADNTVGRTIEQTCRNDLILIDEVGFAPLDPPAASSCSGSSQPPTRNAPWPWHPTHRSKSGDGSSPTNPPPSPSSTGSATTPTSSPPQAKATGSPTAQPEEVTARTARGILLATSEDPTWPPARTSTWPLTLLILGEIEVCGPLFFGAFLGYLWATAIWAAGHSVTLSLDQCLVAARTASSTILVALSAAPLLFPLLSRESVLRQLRDP